MPAGRPTILTQEMIDKAKTYLDTCHATPIETEKGGVSYVDVQLPKVVDLALMLKVSKSTVYEWCQGESQLAQQFSDIVNEINAAQEKMLIDKGLGGLFQPKTTGMLLSKHGYSEKIETDITSKGESINTIDPKIQSIAQEYENKLKENL